MIQYEQLFDALGDSVEPSFVARNLVALSNVPDNEN